jgi:phi13 family phage major tail protein
MERTINPAVVGEAIDVSDLYIAPVNADTDAAYTPGAPESLAPVATIARETAVNTKTRYYSGKALFTDSSEGETKLTVAIPGLTIKGRSNLLGKPYDAANGKMYDDGVASAPYFAIGYRVSRPDGVAEYAWLLKGKFAIPKDEAETKTDSINEKTLSLEFTAVATNHKFQLGTNRKGGAKGVYADTSDAKFTGAEAWFDAVQKPPEIASGT